MTNCLIDSFTGFCTPGESVRRPLQVDHQRPELSSNARGTSDDDDLIPDSERVPAHTLIAQLGGAAQLDSPTLLDSVFVRSLDVNERMWIAVHKPHQFALQLDLFTDVVG